MDQVNWKSEQVVSLLKMLRHLLLQQRSENSRDNSFPWDGFLLTVDRCIDLSAAAEAPPKNAEQAAWESPGSEIDCADILTGSRPTASNGLPLAGRLRKLPPRI